MLSILVISLSECHLHKFQQKTKIGDSCACLLHKLQLVHSLHFITHTGDCLLLFLGKRFNKLNQLGSSRNQLDTGHWKHTSLHPWYQGQGLGIQLHHVDGTICGLIGTTCLTGRWGVRWKRSDFCDIMWHTCSLHFALISANLGNLCFLGGFFWS